MSFFNIFGGTPKSNSADIAFERLMHEVQRAKVRPEVLIKISEAVLTVLRENGYESLSLADLTTEVKVPNDKQTGISVNIDTNKLNSKNI